MIIIEGSDGVGKTTLAKSLQLALKSAYVHYGPLPDWWTHWDYTTRCIKHAVYDRYHWSAAAYSLVVPQPWVRGSMDTTVKICMELDKELAFLSKEAYATVCLYRADDAWYDSQDFEDPLFTGDECKLVNRWYKEHRNLFTYSVAVDTAGYPHAGCVLDLLMSMGIDLAKKVY